MPDPKEFKYTRRTCTFVWSGGPYIDIHMHGKAVEVINVWNYQTNTANITTRKEFLAECEEWLEATSHEDMRNYREFARS